MLISLGKLRAKADKAFSDYIRQRDSGKCCTCKRQMYWGYGDCGHWLPKGNHNWGVRYDERNAHFQCKICNQSKDVRKLYNVYISIRYGITTMGVLMQQKHWTLIEFVNRELGGNVFTTREAFEFIIKYYTVKTKGLESGKNRTDIAQRGRITTPADEA